MVIITLCTSCMTVDYVGKSYSKTDKVDIYFDEHKIDRDFEIIGYAVGEGARMKRIQKNLIKKAKEEGADGIIIGGVNRDRSFDPNGVSELHRQISAAFIKY